MGISLKNASFLIKKKLLNDLNFNIDNKESKVILYTDAKACENFKKILYGFYQLQSGNFMIDGYDVVDRPWTKRRVANISPGDRFFKKWPEKLWLFWSLLLNQNFYAKAKQNYIESKYSYLNILSAKNNLTDIDMRKDVEQIVDRFVQTSIEIENQWLDDFFEQIKTFNEKQIDLSEDCFDAKIKVVIKNYYVLVEKTLNLRFFETFLQSLWDKVYSFLDLNSACACEYNAKHSKKRSERRKAKALAFHQQNYVIRKRLKIIDIMVRELKRKQQANNSVLRSLNHQIVQSVRKSHNNKIKKVDDLFKWRQLSLDQRVEFKQKQEKMYYEALTDEGNFIRGKVVERMHKYHKLLLSDDIKLGHMNEFKAEATAMKSKIITVYKQALLWIDNTINELEISFGLIKSTLKLSLLNTIYFKMLMNIYLKKANFVFEDVLAKLTQNEAQEFVQATENLKKIDNKNSFIFLEQKLKNVVDLNDRIFLLKTHGIVEKTFDEIINEDWEDFGQYFFGNKNHIDYAYDDKYLHIYGEKIKWKHDGLKPTGRLILNPHKIYLSKKEFKGDYISIEVKQVPQTKFLDKNLKCFEDKKGYKFLVLTTQELEKGNKIYFTQDSILKVH